jgi:hypothetical protein
MRHITHSRSAAGRTLLYSSKLDAAAIRTGTDPTLAPPLLQKEYYMNLQAKIVALRKN